jgi:ABC-type multidrug transport system fused ATPase/permease subunit
LWQHRGRLAFGCALLLVNRLSALVLPVCAKYVIDGVPDYSPVHGPVPLALVAGAASLVQAGTGFALSQVLGVAAQRIIADLRTAVHLHVLKLPMSEFDATRTGALISRIMTDAEGIRNLVGTGLIELAGGVLTAVVASGALLYLNWRLTLGIAVVLGGFGGAMAFAFKRLRPLYYEQRDANAEVTGRLGETLGGIRIVKSYSAEQREHAVFSQGIARLFDVTRRSMLAASATTSMSTVAIGLVAMVMIAVGGQATASGTMTAGDIVMYIFFVALLNTPVVQMASITTQLTDAFAGLDRVREILAAPTEDQEDHARQRLPVVRGDVAFDSVSFEYTPGVPVLKDVSFVAPSGTTTALVGPSGSGKSTLIALIMAFNRPTQGRVCIDGIDLASVALSDYRRSLGAVLQDNILFDGTIADNIRLGAPGATLDDVRRVSRIAHCDEFIHRFKDGYDTIVGERGLKLSGGQRQRVAIARAVLADPRILVLDEATSSLDSESEAMIQDGLNALRAGRTTFVIAHRLSTIRSANLILVMDKGTVVERGTHADLMEARGLYRQLHDRQYTLESNRFINPGEEFASDSDDEDAG